eukprot:353513-Chlamydomonas_euryale.AAC.5
METAPQSRGGADSQQPAGYGISAPNTFLHIRRLAHMRSEGHTRRHTCMHDAGHTRRHARMRDTGDTHMHACRARHIRPSVQQRIAQEAPT